MKCTGKELCYHEPMDFIVAGFNNYESHQTINEGHKSLVFFYSTGKVIANVPCRFPAHAVYRNPLRLNEFLVFDKARFESARITLLKDFSAQVDYFSATPEHLFYGHGCYLGDGSTFICTERKNNAQGKLTLRDSANFNVLREFPLGGIGPHDCALMPDGKTVAVACDGVGVVARAPHFRIETSKVVYVDLESGEIVSASISDRENLALGHLAVSSRNEVFALLNRDNDVRCTDSGLFALGKMGEAMRTCYASEELNKKLVEQNLSCTLDEQKRTVITVSPQSNLIIAWSMDDGSYLRHVETLGPAGVTTNTRSGTYVVTAFPNRILHLDSFLSIIKEERLELSGNFETHILGCDEKIIGG